MKMEKLMEGFNKWLKEGDEIDEHFIVVLYDLFQEFGFEQVSDRDSTLEKKYVYKKPIISGGTEVGDSIITIFYYTRNPQRSFQFRVETFINAMGRDQEIYYKMFLMRDFQSAESLVQTIRLALKENDEKMNKWTTHK